MPQIRELRDEDFFDVLEFTDREIGSGYFSVEKLGRIFKATKVGGRAASFVLEDDEGGIEGLRLTYPPNQWIERDERQPIHPDKWQVPVESAAYFQSLFLSAPFQKSGWGKRMSMASIEILKMFGAKAVVAHSWDESPGNSSRKYLEALGFQPIVQIPNFWKCIDYECTRCGKPCVCTATEMVLYL